MHLLEQLRVLADGEARQALEQPESGIDPGLPGVDRGRRGMLWVLGSNPVPIQWLVLHVMNATARHRQATATGSDVPSGAVAGDRGDNDRKGGTMATAEDCRIALEKLIGEVEDMDPADRARKVLDRTMSLRVPDLGVTFLTRVSPQGADPVREVANGATAQVRFTADSDIVVAIGANPGSFLRSWVTGKVKVQGNPLDLLHLRRLL